MSRHQSDPEKRIHLEFEIFENVLKLFFLIYIKIFDRYVNKEKK
jgi:hypothetical protein